MESQLMLAVLAVGIGTLVAVMTFVPLVVISYRRRGTLSAARLFGWISLCIYFIAIWCYTLLPIPVPGEYRCAGVQLNLWTAFTEIWLYDTSGFRALLTNPVILQLALNIVLFIPLGFLLRTMYRKGIAVATLAGFVLSLFIEFTQLTGVWWIYDCAYRVFDVSDLLTNTVGAIFGSLFAILFVRPNSVTDDPEQPRKITAFRRLLGMTCDVLFIVILGTILGVLWRAGVILLAGSEALDSYLFIEQFLSVGVPLVVQLIMVFTTGSPVGERAVMLAPDTQHMPVFLGRLLRFITGIGGFGILTTAEYPGSELMALSFVVLSIIFVFTTKNHRGLSALLAGFNIRDSRINR